MLVLMIGFYFHIEDNPKDPGERPRKIAAIKDAAARAGGYQPHIEHHGPSTTVQVDIDDEADAVVFRLSVEPLLAIGR